MQAADNVTAIRVSPTAICFFVFPILLVLTFGCSKAPFGVAPVRGKVTIDGQSMMAGQVMFAPQAKAGSINAGKPAFGIIQPDGTYALSTYGSDDGAVVGQHTVAIFDTSERPKFSRLSIRGRRTVTANQDNHFDFEISSEYIRRFGELAESD